jgi:hypothetical protein
LRNVFNLTQEGVDYLFDATEESLQGVTSILPEDKQHYTFKEVTELTAVEKAILSRKRRY